MGAPLVVVLAGHPPASLNDNTDRTRKDKQMGGPPTSRGVTASEVADMINRALGEPVRIKVSSTSPLRVVTRAGANELGFYATDWGTTQYTARNISGETLAIDDTGFGLAFYNPPRRTSSSPVVVTIVAKV